MSVTPLSPVETPQKKTDHSSQSCGKAWAGEVRGEIMKVLSITRADRAISAVMGKRYGPADAVEDKLQQKCPSSVLYLNVLL